MKLTVNLEKNSYPIYIENGILARAGKHISESFSGEKSWSYLMTMFPPVWRNSHLLSGLLRL